MKGLHHAEPVVDDDDDVEDTEIEPTLEQSDEEFVHEHGVAGLIRRSWPTLLALAVLLIAMGVGGALYIGRAHETYVRAEENGAAATAAASQALDGKELAELVAAACAAPTIDVPVSLCAKAEPLASAPLAVTTSEGAISVAPPAVLVPGPSGPPGPAGRAGADSTIPGEPGQPGSPGQAGVPGEPGADSTVPGAAGSNGSSGSNGVDGQNGRDGVNGADSAVPGPVGAPGQPGAAGADGAPGAVGVGLAAVRCQDDGNWAFTLTDGSVVVVAGPCRAEVPAPVTQTTTAIETTTVTETTTTAAPTTGEETTAPEAP